MKNITYINAGAGSGKTYTLTKILAEKLAEKDRKGKPVLNPSSVILTTFTELAAAEFREKARQQLLAGNNIEAATQLDSAAIGTVHSVALQFIKKFWYLLEYGADVQTISDRDADFYMSQSLARIVNTPDHKEDLENFRKFREYYDICDGYGHPDYFFWKHYLSEVVEKMEYYNVDDVEESIVNSIATLRQVYNGAVVDDAMKKSLRGYLKKYQDYCLTIKDGRSKDKAKRHAEMVEALHNKCDGINDLLRLLSDMKEPVGGEKKIEESCPGYNRFIDTLSKLPASSSQLDILEPFICSVFRVAKAWRKDYVAYKKQNHLISYNDMERLFLQLLEKEQEVQDYVRDNYRIVMVDEFQDSNPMQLKIFNCLSELIAPKGGHSYWVGDPKQAIYGFRGADTELVNAVARPFKFYDDTELHKGEDERNLGSGRLVESWRSRDTLVYLVNDCFKKAFEKQDDLDPLCITLDPHFKDEGLKSDAFVHWNIDARNKEKAADALAWKVKELLDSNTKVCNGKRDEPRTPISPKSIAILCRKNETCKSLVKSLRKYGIPVSEAEDNIMQRVEVQLVITLLQFVQNPKNKHTLANLKRLLWGKSTKDILRHRIDYINNKKEDAKDEWMMDDPRVKKLADLSSRLDSLSIPELVEALIYECNLHSLVERWGDPDIRKQNLSTLQHLAQDYDQMCLQMGLGTSINGFIYYLYTIEPEKEKDNMSDTVKVFTYHGSKGLEWPIVIMNELGTDALDDKEFSKKQFAQVQVCEVVSEGKSTQDNPFDKTYYLHLFPQTLKTNNSNFSEIVLDNITNLPLYKPLKKRAEGEERRLLYVGMTRAKDCLYSIGYGNNPNAWLKNAGIEGVTADDFWGSQGIKPDVQNVTVPEEQNEVKTKPYSIKKKPESHDERDKQYLSPSTISEYAGYNQHKVFGERGNDISTKGWNKADYATIGSCIHDFFAVFIPGDREGNKRKASSVIGGYGLMGILGGHIGAIIDSAEHLYAQLNARFPCTRTEREYPFRIQLATGQTLRGEMDLLWFYNDAESEHCILVDYKSYPGTDLDKHTETHYAQLSAYADALKKSNIEITHAFVYYPVQGILHELEYRKSNTIV